MRVLTLAAIAVFIASCAKEAAPPPPPRPRAVAATTKAMHPPVEDAAMASIVDAAIATGKFLPEELPPVQGDPYLRGKIVIVCNDDDGDPAMKYSWLNARVPADRRAHALSEVGTLAIAERRRDFAETLSGQGGSDDFYNTYAVTLVDRRENVIAGSRVFGRTDSRYFPPHNQDIVAAMIAWIDGLPRR